MRGSRGLGMTGRENMGAINTHLSQRKKRKRQLVERIKERAEEGAREGVGEEVTGGQTGRGKVKMTQRRAGSLRKSNGGPEEC